ncbi:MAG TPA: hypothetical protein VGF88_10605 [Acidobacteriaceae bacterium]|jgi:hypothetical protein
MPLSGRFAAGLLIGAATASLGAQAPASPNPAQSARDLVRDVIYNELHDRERDSHWEYRAECVSSAENSIREQVETDKGPVFRLLAQDGNPLDAAQREREDQRLNKYLQDPAEIARVERSHREDEERLATVMAMLPQAFLYDYQGREADGLVHLAFRPDPAFTPTTYEARIVHALNGTMSIDPRFKRMIDMRGSLAERLDFGYGFFGHVEKGARFEIHRRRVSPDHWKTDLVDVHIQGKILMLRTVGKDQHEARSDFRPVPSGTTLLEARDMLNQAVDRGTEARLLPIPAARK